MDTTTNTSPQTFAARAREAVRAGALLGLSLLAGMFAIFFGLLFASIILRAVGWIVVPTV
jgi:hypothetical protein